MAPRDLPGAPVPGWRAPGRPGPDRIEGRFAVLERFDPARHAAEIHAADTDPAVWDYMAAGPFDDAASYRAWAERSFGADPFAYAICVGGRAVGAATFLRIDPAHGVIEIGHILMTPALQRRAASSEAIMLMIAWAFEAGYRRVEWKCNALNAASRRAALRYGFSFEGIFRQHMIVKGRNRDTAWFAITDADWPRIEAAHRAWLSAENIGEDGLQRRNLAAFMGEAGA
ncbi:MAG: GNAT family protein [Paracoccus sp. (in: a-proteobacteria)]|nr:GNAT family protein [Paracoccus sp. (in: a-proteobacteria)]